VKSAEGGEIIEDREKQISSAFLDDNRDAFAYLERVLDGIETRDCNRSRRRPEQRREHLERGGFSGAVRTKESEYRSAAHCERQTVDGPDIRLPSVGECLDQVANDDRIRDVHG